MDSTPASRDPGSMIDLQPQDRTGGQVATWQFSAGDHPENTAHQGSATVLILDYRQPAAMGNLPLPGAPFPPQRAEGMAPGGTGQ